MAIKCCRYCVSPKRYPGCHGCCTEYLEEKAVYDELKAADDKRRAVSNGIYYQRSEKAYKALKNHRQRG